VVKGNRGLRRPGGAGRRPGGQEEKGPDRRGGPGGEEAAGERPEAEVGSQEGEGQQVGRKQKHAGIGKVDGRIMPDQQRIVSPEAQGKGQKPDRGVIHGAEKPNGRGPKQPLPPLCPPRPKPGGAPFSPTGAEGGPAQRLSPRPPAGSGAAKGPRIWPPGAGTGAFGGPAASGPRGSPRPPPRWAGPPGAASRGAYAGWFTKAQRTPTSERRPSTPSSRPSPPASQ